MSGFFAQFFCWKKKSNAFIELNSLSKFQQKGGVCLKNEAVELLNFSVGGFDHDVTFSALGAWLPDVARCEGQLAFCAISQAPEIPS